MRDPATPDPAGDVEVVGSVDPLAVEWDELATRVGAPPFARPGWVRAWWAAFGRGSLEILGLRRDGQLAGVLPLARRGSALRSCSNVHSPVFECVAAEPGAATALLAAATDSAQAVLLDRLDSEGVLAAACRHEADRARRRCVLLGELSAPYVGSEAEHETFEESLGGKLRREVRRRRRRLDGCGEVTVLVVEGPQAEDELDLRFRQLLEVEGSGWKGEQGTAIRSRPETRRFYAEIAGWAAEHGLLRLSFLCLDGRPLAARLMVGDERRQYSLKEGYDEEFARFSPGLLLAMDDIQQAFEGGRSFELGTGMTRAKQDFETADREIQQIGVFPRSAAGTLARVGAQWRVAAHRRARQSALLQRAREAVRTVRARALAR